MSTIAANQVTAYEVERRARLLSVPQRSSPLLVANANATGIRRHPELVRHARRLLESVGGRRIDVRLTDSLDELSEVALEEERRLILLGGDGTLHALANLPDRRVELALLPVGGANNIARSLGIPTDLKDAAELAMRGPVRALDLITATAGGRKYAAVEGISVGYHAQARARYHAMNSSDRAAGLSAAASALLHFRPLSMLLEADGEAEVVHAAQLFVANMPLFGPRLLVAPTADPADGYLDVVRIEALGRAALLTILAQLRRGTHFQNPGVTFQRARTIRIATGGRSPVIADTVDLGPGPVDLTIDPAGLLVVAPER